MARAQGVEWNDEAWHWEENSVDLVANWLNTHVAASKGKR